MEGMIPMLARAAGANRVVGYDRLRNGRNRVALVQRVYGREFEHSTGQSLADFRRQSDEQFDVVVFSGVLCHMFDPLGGLALAASFAKPGGLLIFESSAIVREDCALHFNRRGRYYPEANFFQPTAEALDHFFRFIGLAAIDGEYFIQRTFPAPLIRIGVTCRVTAKPLPSPGDSWMKQGFEVDFGEFRLGRRNKNIEVPDLIKYVGIDRSKAVDPQTGTMNIPWFIERYPALRISAAMTELSLAAAAVSNPPAASVPL
jgi:SAM-dependent methyltransferase